MFYPLNYRQLNLATLHRFELRLTVLETGVLPLTPQGNNVLAPVPGIEPGFKD
jgi:hypothetical protein